jgi:hypothetical protein
MIMQQFLRDYRIFLWAVSTALIILPVKYMMHYFGLEFIEQTSLHNSVVSSAIFVLGFVLSATIADYKESERIPAEFASNIEDMYNDAKEVHKHYSKFSLDHFRESLIDILGVFREGTRMNRKKLDAKSPNCKPHLQKWNKLAYHQTLSSN